MFTIDLLKGQGVPAKSRPEGIVIASVTLAVPIIVAIVLFGFYLRNSIIIPIQRQDIANYEAKISKLSNAITLQKSLEKEQSIIGSCISEVKSSIGRHTQWSPVLATFVENMPDTVIMTTLDIKQTYIKSKVPQKDDPQKKVDISIPVRTLHMSVYGSSQSSCSEAIREFRERLLSSSLLGPRLEDIRVSQKSTFVENQSVISYEIDCIFKPGM